MAVRISRPRDEVFAYVTDARNRPQWDDSVASEELTSPEPIGLGTTVRTRLRSIEFSVTGRPTGLLRLLEPLIARNTRKNLDRAFARLKNLLEADTSS